MLNTTLSTFALIVLAEMGDKSQLICMALASRHRAWPVLAGAALAFALLNLLAVLFGSLIGEWIPRAWLSALVALLFTGFGLSALWQKPQTESPDPGTKASAFLGAFAFIALAEMGDKTQLTVAALSSTSGAAPVYLAATAALLFTSALGVAGGNWLRHRVPLHRLHQAGGILFLLFAAWALYDTCVAATACAP